jgi:hypothetical protein
MNRGVGKTEGSKDLVQTFCISDNQSFPRLHRVVRGTGTPEDKDEVNRREVYECDG